MTEIFGCQHTFSSNVTDQAEQVVERDSALRHFLVYIEMLRTSNHAVGVQVIKTEHHNSINVLMYKPP